MPYDNETIDKVRQHGRVMGRRGIAASADLFAGSVALKVLARIGAAGDAGAIRRPGASARIEAAGFDPAQGARAETGQHFQGQHLAKRGVE